jgi:hypothetical protein
MHVAGLTAKAKRWWWWWYMPVTITIADANGSPVPNATVDGSFSHAISGDVPCTTKGTGKCGVVSALILDGTRTITYTVTNVTHATLTYQADDSIATSVTVKKR